MITDGAREPRGGAVPRGTGIATAPVHQARPGEPRKGSRSRTWKRDGDDVLEWIWETHRLGNDGYYGSGG